jgi:hypothetical protein
MKHIKNNPQVARNSIQLFATTDTKANNGGGGMLDSSGVECDSLGHQQPS